MNKANWFKTYMSIVGVLGNLMFYIQAYAIFDKGSAGSVSLSAFLISVVGLTSWLAYGVYLKDIPLMVANAFGVVGALLVVSGVLLHG